MFFFLNDPATPDIYTLPLHDPLRIPRLNHRLYHFGGDTCSLAELAEIVRGIVPESEISFDDTAPDFPHVYIADDRRLREDRKSTRLNSSHANISYAVFCLKKKTHKEY